MVKTEIIKQHNKNLKELYDLISQYQYKVGVYAGNGWDFEKYSINKVSKIFRAKKTIANAYNEYFAEKYNDLIRVLNNRLDQDNRNKKKLEAFAKRHLDLKKIQSKLMEMCEKVEKPRNYNYCVNLKNKLEQAEAMLNSTKGGFCGGRPQEDSVSQASYQTHFFTGVNGVSMAYTEVKHKKAGYRTQFTGNSNSASKKEEVKKVENEIKRIRQEIKNQKNYEYNMKLYDMFCDCEDLTSYLDGTAWSDIMENHYRATKKNKELIEETTDLLQKFELILDNEKTLVSKLGNFELRDLKTISNTVKPFEIKENMICYEMGDGVERKEYSLHDWSNVCNKYIDYFKVDFVKKCDVSKLEEDFESEVEDSF